jgi:hypothetical protein
VLDGIRSGFEITLYADPKEELVAAARTEVQKSLDKLDESQKALKVHGFTRLKAGEKYLELFRHGWHVSQRDNSP